MNCLTVSFGVIGFIVINQKMSLKMIITSWLVHKTFENDIKFYSIDDGIVLVPW
jgi:hypothetical protein